MIRISSGPTQEESSGIKVGLCYVLGCTKEDRKHKDIFYPRFPRDERLMEWIKFTGRHDFNLEVVKNNWQICSRHFTENDILRDDKRKVIKYDAIPTLYPPSSNSVLRALLGPSKKEEQSDPIISEHSYGKLKHLEDHSYVQSQIEVTGLDSGMSSSQNQNLSLKETRPISLSSQLVQGLKKNESLDSKKETRPISLSSQLAQGLKKNESLDPKKETRPISLSSQLLQELKKNESSHGKTSISGTGNKLNEEGAIEIMEISDNDTQGGTAETTFSSLTTNSTGDKPNTDPKNVFISPEVSELKLLKYEIKKMYRELHDCKDCIARLQKEVKILKRVKSKAPRFTVKVPNSIL